MSAITELFEPGEYLDPKRSGYFTLCGRDGGKWREVHHELRLLPTAVNELNPATDSWITQATFDRPNRRAINLQSVGLLFVDLDTYHIEGLAGKTPEEQTALLITFCGQKDIPTPSVVLYSGRGLQAKWFLERSIKRVDLFKWNETEIALVRVLEPFGADMAARDVSRVLRVDRTTNTKSGEIVRLIYVTGGVESCPARYSFDDLQWALQRACSVLETKRRVRHALGTESVSWKAREMNLRRLNWTRLHDLQRLWELRGGVIEGFRELTLFWELAFILRAEPGRTEDLWAEAEALAKRIDPNHEFYSRSDLSTLYRRAKAQIAREIVVFHGRMLPALYTPRNQYLIEVFRITPDEERQMHTIISEAEKRRRYTETRRAAGIRERPRYVNDRPWELWGVSRRTWERHRQSLPV